MKVEADIFDALADQILTYSERIAAPEVQYRHIPPEPLTQLRDNGQNEPDLLRVAEDIFFRERRPARPRRVRELSHRTPLRRKNLRG